MNFEGLEFRENEVTKVLHVGRVPCPRSIDFERLFPRTKSQSVSLLLQVFFSNQIFEQSLHEMRLVGGSMRDAGRCLHSLFAPSAQVYSHKRLRCEVMTIPSPSEFRGSVASDDRFKLPTSVICRPIFSVRDMPIHWPLVQGVQVHRLEFSLLNVRCHKYI